LTAIVTSPRSTRAYDTRVRELVQRSVALACASALLLSPAAASGVSQRTVTITLFGNGKAFWKLDSSRETSRLALAYHWHGVLSFDVPLPILADPKHRRLSVSGAATLVASWSGQYRTKTSGTLTTCTYKGTKVRTRVTAKLAKGRARNTLELTLHPRAAEGGFFADKGRRAVVRCSAGYRQTAPSHFAPSWFFRDNLQDHGRFTSDTAVIVVPTTLLPRGTATVAFPNEKGRNDSVALGHLAWNNRAETALRAR
jgi:hypothetical protein